VTRAERAKRLVAEAKFWRTSPKQITTWRRRSYPTSDAKELARILLANRRTPSHIRGRALEVLGKGKGKRTAAATQAEEKLGKMSLSMVEDLEGQAARYFRMQENAQEAGDLTMEETAFDQRVKVYKALIAIRKELAGLDQDGKEVITRREIEQIIVAVGARAALAIERMLDQLGENLIDLKRIDEVTAVIEPYLVKKLFVEPFAFAADLAAGCGLPSWVVQAMSRACGDAVENGESEFNAVTLNAGLGKTEPALRERKI